MRRSSILIVFIAALMVLVVYLTLELNRAGREEIIAQFNTHEALSVRQAVREVELHLDECARTLQFLAVSASVQQRDRERMQTDFQAYLDSLKLAGDPSLAVYDTQGSIDDSLDASAKSRSCPGCDFLAWAKQTQNRGKIFVSPWPQIEGEVRGRPSAGRFLVALPLYRDAAGSSVSASTPTWTGVLVLTVDLEALLATHLSLWSTQPASDRIWILDRDGTVLFQTEHPEMIHKNIRQIQPSCHQCHESFDYAERMLAQGQGTAAYKLKGQPGKLAVFAPMEFANASWVVVTNAPYDEVTGFVRRGFTKVLWLLGCLVATMSLVALAQFDSYRSKGRAEAETKHWQEKHGLEERIRQSAKRYRALFERSPDGILTVDPETTLPIEFNAAAHRQLDYSREEFAEARIADYSAIETPGDTQAQIRKVLREGRTDWETQHRKKRGRSATSK